MTKFSINQDVGCLMHGIGKVSQINLDVGFVRAAFAGNREITYTLEGRYIGHASSSITLFDVNVYNQIQDCIKPVVMSNWNPETEEWCWFYDHTGKTILAQFSGRIGIHSPLKCYYTTRGDYYPYVAKYEGELPKHLTEPLPDPFLHKKSK